MGRTACTEPQCLYKDALYLTVELYLYSPYGPYGLYRASVPVQGCTFTFRIYNKKKQSDFSYKILFCWMPLLGPPVRRMNRFLRYINIQCKKWEGCDNGKFMLCPSKALWKPQGVVSPETVFFPLLVLQKEEPPVTIMYQFGANSRPDTVVARATWKNTSKINGYSATPDFQKCLICKWKLEN